MSIRWKIFKLMGTLDEMGYEEGVLGRPKQVREYVLKLASIIMDSKANHRDRVLI